MELVYLWVESYKNIKNQGFNFSPRFSCKYDKNTNKLIIDEKKDYVNIFPNNVNITAIVGENGSGKSSVFEYLYRLLKSSHEINKRPTNKLFSPDYIRWQDALNCILVVNIENKLYAIGRISKPENKLIFSGLSVDNLVRFYEINEEHTLDNESLRNFAELIGNEIEHNSSVLWIDYSFGVPYISHDNYHGYEKDYFENSTRQRFFIEPNKSYNKEKAINIRVEEEKNTKRILNYFFNPKDNHSEVVDFFNPNILELRINFTRLNLSSADRVSSKTLEALNNIYIELHDRDSDYVIEMQKAKLLKENIGLLNELLNLTIKYQINYDLPIDINISKLKSTKNLDLLLDVLSQLPRYLTLDLVRDETEMRNVQRFSTLSSGEKGLLKIIGNLDYLIKITNSDSIILFFDEIEMYLHPEWQRKFLYYIIPILESYGQKQFFCLMATHSPFILSDLSKENIVFLEKGEQVYANIETFGANIHTLLSHGFFMKNGLMGEFAKSKINDVYDFLSSPNSNPHTNLTQTKAQEIINLIGEPILKKELQYRYDEKFETSEIDKEIREHQAAIERLQAKRSRND